MNRIRFGSTVSRRRFGTIVSGGIGIALVGCRTFRSVPEERFEFEEAHMGLPFRIVLYADTKEKATACVRKGFDRIEELNRLLSDYDPESELSHLSASAGSGKVVKLSKDLGRVLWRAQEISQASDGAFDVTVGPLVQLWRRARRQRELPPMERIVEAQAKVGWRHLVLTRQRNGGLDAQLMIPGMRLDLGGIAKGDALDETIKVLNELGIRRALVSGGGDMRALGAPPGENGWKVELSPIDAPGADPARLVRIKDRSLCTSGDLFQHVEIDGIRYSHIVDPRTGLGLTDHSLVTVTGPEAMTTDALATAVSVLGPNRGLVLLRMFPRFEASVSRYLAGRIESVVTPNWK